MLDQPSSNAERRAVVWSIDPVSRREHASNREHLPAKARQTRSSSEIELGPRRRPTGAPASLTVVGVVSRCGVSRDRQGLTCGAHASPHHHGREAWADLMMGRVSPTEPSDPATVDNREPSGAALPGGGLNARNAGPSALVASIPPSEPAAENQP